ncbi:5-oxoprolinase subunit PxpB [Saccharothrix coeruleofusca]|uniref:Allophanate hydrolase n=1 Tax=Saccharothrix coeruleofusca TaxID=33919 RepID=A0A918ATD9_9PSEU|nr:5-oxoprolinase subunit PxpB [Saccharothrix coeruleofusca]MBP2339641.1 KipI family sensor histidine kinase inhibitor [Saccharothrix coeruleofusca]GGP81120.1 allophanate hydrolase [Saccharothrix coeruleofusca]
MRLRRCGTDAVLVEVDSLDEVEAVRAAVAAAALPEVVELVPAARTVLVTTRPGGLAAVRRVLDAVDPARRAPVAAREVVIPVRYDGPDLELVASTAGVPVDEVVRLHSSARYTVAFCGFAPGFGYLVGLPEPLRQPRLDSPRTKVPAGSVGVAGEYTAAYPRATPGGWRLIGRTDAPLFDPRRAEPALLAPGDRVRFEVVA